MTQRWEYTRVNWANDNGFSLPSGERLDFGDSDIEDVMLRTYGALGWELTAIYNDGLGTTIYYFKRPLLHEVKG